MDFETFGEVRLSERLEGSPTECVSQVDLGLDSVGESDVAYAQERINFEARGRKGLGELEAGQGIAHEEIKAEFAEVCFGQA